MTGHISCCKSPHKICQHTKVVVLHESSILRSCAVEIKGRKKEKKREKSASQGRRCVSFAPIFVRLSFVCWHI